MQQNHLSLYESTFAIMFFGTPHRGSTYANLGLVVQKIATATGMNVNSTVLKSLVPNEQYLTMLHEEFTKILSTNTLFVDTFQEGKGYKSFRILRGRVCSLPLERNRHD